MRPRHCLAARTDGVCPTRDYYAMRDTLRARIAKLEANAKRATLDHARTIAAANEKIDQARAEGIAEGRRLERGGES